MSTCEHVSTYSQACFVIKLRRGPRKVLLSVFFSSKVEVPSLKTKWCLWNFTSVHWSPTKFSTPSAFLTESVHQSAPAPFQHSPLCHSGKYFSTPPLSLLCTRHFLSSTRVRLNSSPGVDVLPQASRACIFLFGRQACPAWSNELISVMPYLSELDHICCRSTVCWNVSCNLLTNTALTQRWLRSTLTG